MNNGGWGLRIMLVFCAIISLFFLFSTNVVGKALDQFISKKEIKEEITYFDLEFKMKNSAKKYIKNTYTDIENDTKIPVKLSTLINYYYLAPIKDIYTEEACNGYVMYIKEEDDIKYKPYLKCSGYKTNGYDANYD